jgi:hypothetical protein
MAALSLVMMFSRDEAQESGCRTGVTARPAPRASGMRARGRHTAGPQR